MKSLYEQFWNKVKEAQKILLICHKKPDGDALGSMCALKIWLNSMEKEVKMASIDKPSKKYSFLPYINDVENKISPDEHDLIIILDCGAHYMTDFHVEYPQILPNSINIDHHASNDNFGSLNIIESDAASTTIILYKIFDYFGICIDPDMATCLMTGLYNDTGSFMHSNTSGEVFTVASELLRSGAKLPKMIKSLFKTNSVETLRSWGKVFLNSRVTDENYLVSVVKEEDVKDGGDIDQLSGAIDYLNMVPNVNFSLLLKEDRERIKGSLRTRKDNVNLAEIAKKYGGGGHPKAAGFSIPKIEFQKLSSRSLNL
jgi:phosphoesterase RecJ-like protein